MSTPNPGNSRRQTQTPELPKGEIISTYDRYEDAKHAVDVLARASFPVQQISILGNDLRSVERVTGRLTYGRVALMGALSGAYLGLFLGLLLFIFQPDNAMNRNRRDFSSVMQMVASRYDLIVDPELVFEARRILTEHAHN